MFWLCPPGLCAQSPPHARPTTKEIAVTIDDLPLNGPQFEAGRLRAMTEKLLAGLGRHRIPAVGFVNESLLYVPGGTDARIALLKAWAAAGVELGNHTFSHVSFHSVPLAEYEDDFVRGEAVTRMLLKPKGQKPRYFRHPFLHMGPTAEAEKSFESFIAERGYRVAPVTVDTMDWMFLAAYSKARGDAGASQRVSDEYLKYVRVKLDFCERVSAELFGRPIRHILLLHANELNADNFEGLVGVLRERGYGFITLAEALGDPVYQFPEKYTPTSDWLSHWSFSKGREFKPPMPPEFIQKQFAEQ
ncbi:MAG TPA: polysaccharide deacetylase family protein [Pyrinomonadaceae bacterium]|nr:polysaccharide deacetylase family protein [Pyrinomonadaceae bacterium]